jgi:hypothetical protein
LQLVNSLTPFKNGLSPAAQKSLLATLTAQEITSVQEEVIRRQETCFSKIDISDFARFNVTTINFKGLKFKLDKIGVLVFKDKYREYGNKYTTGVYESVTCSILYKEYYSRLKESHLKSLYSVPLAERKGRVKKNHLEIDNSFYTRALINNSDVLPIFCTLVDKVIKPVYILDTLSNQHVKHAVLHGLNNSFDKGIWLQLSDSLLKNNDVVLYKCTMNKGRKKVVYYATSDQLFEHDLVSDFIRFARAHGQLKVYQLNMVELLSIDVDKIYTQFSLSKKQRPINISHSVHISDVSNQLESFTFKCIDKSIINKFRSYRFTPGSASFRVTYLKKENNLRKSERFYFDCKAFLKTNLFSKQQCKLLDLSKGGANLELKEKKVKLPKFVRVNVPELNLNKMKFIGIKYEVIDYNVKNSKVRLALHTKNAKTISTIESLLAVKKVCTQSKVRPNVLFSVFSEISLLGLSGDVIFCGNSHSLAESMYKGLASSNQALLHTQAEQRCIQLGHILVDDVNNNIATDMFESMKGGKQYSNTIWHKNTDGVYGHFIGDYAHINKDIVKLNELVSKGHQSLHVDFKPFKGNGMVSEGSVNIEGMISIKSTTLLNHQILLTGARFKRSSLQ